MSVTLENVFLNMSNDNADECPNQHQVMFAGVFFGRVAQWVAYDQDIQVCNPNARRQDIRVAGHFGLPYCCCFNISEIPAFE